MTLVTLFVHRIRAARHAARQRAPGDVVRALPIRVWTGARWVSEKDWVASHANEIPSTPGHETPTPGQGPTVQEPTREVDAQSVTESASFPNWFASQGECAICLSSFVRGDRVRVLPCSHVFHVEEVDGWLLNRKKVVSEGFVLICLENRNEVYPIRSHISLLSFLALLVTVHLTFHPVSYL